MQNRRGDPRIENGGRPQDDRRFICYRAGLDQLEATIYPDLCEPRTARSALPKKPSAKIALKARTVKRRVMSGRLPVRSRRMRQATAGRR